MIIWKLVTCQRITSKNTRPRWVDTWARDTVRWYWSADILFWQLSIDHKIDVQYVYNISFPVLPNLPESVRLNIGMPVVRTDGCSFIRCTVTWLPNFLGWVDLLTIVLRWRALRARELRYEELWRSQRVISAEADTLPDPYNSSDDTKPNSIIVDL